MQSRGDAGYQEPFGVRDLVSGVEGVVISFDYHRVLDTDHELRPPERVGFLADDCHLPLNVCAILASTFVRTTTLSEQ